MPEEVVLDQSADVPSKALSLKRITLIVYVLQAASFILGVTSVVGAVVNYVKRRNTVRTMYESHFNWQIKTFWWSLVIFLV